MAVQPIKIPITAIDRTKKAFQSVTRSLNVVKKALFNFKVGITAAVGAAGLGLLVKNSLESIDALGKTANKLGIATAELQKLRFASQLAGVETRTVDMAVQRFTRRLAEAANGTGEAKDALKELGIDAASLSRQPLEKQMLALAAAFEKVEGSGDRVRLAFKLFDSEGVAFVNTLQAGEKALKDTFSEVDDLGIILSTNAVKGVESFNDSVVKLTTIFKGLINTVAAGLAGPLQVLVEMLTGKLKNALGEGGENVRNFTRELGHGIIDAVEMALTGFVHFINETGRLIDGLREKIHQVQRFLGSDVSPEEYAARVSKIQSALEGLRPEKGSAARVAFFEQINDELSDLFDGAVLSADEISALQDRIAEISSENSTFAGNLVSVNNHLKDLKNKADNLGPGFQKLFSEVKIGTGFLDKMREGLDRNTDAAEGIAAAAKNTSAATAAMVDVADAARKSIDEMTRTAYGAVVPFHVLQEQFENIDAPIRSANDNIKVTTTSIAMLAEQYEQIDAPMKKVSENTAVASRNFLGINENLAAGKGLIEEYIDSIEDLKGALEGATVRGLRRMEDAMIGLINRTMSVKDAFKSMATSIVEDLMRMYIRSQITGPLAQAIFAGMQPSYSMGANPQTYGLEQRANGGPVSAGRPYLVGERGPELMVPNRSGTIVPNNAMGGGVTINQTVQITTGVQQTVRAEVMNMLPDIANATKGAVLDARRRGGSFAAAFG